MSELSTRYATALFELAMESGVPDKYLEQAAFLRDTLQNDEFRGIIEHPNLHSDKKREILENAFSGNIYDDLIGFMCYAISKGREGFLIPAFNALIEMGNIYNRKTTAKVVSAAELNESQVSELKTVLSEKLNKQVSISHAVDPSLLGGMHIHVDGYFIDRTIKKQLSDLESSMKRSIPNDSKA